MYSYYHSLTYCYIVKVEDSTLYGLQDSSTGRVAKNVSKIILLKNHIFSVL